MKRHYCILCTFFVLILWTNVLAQQVVPWTEAQRFYGQNVTITGKIVNTYNSGKACFLNFHPDYKNSFTAVIFQSSFARFPPSPQDFYYGKEVQITGVVKEYKGKPEIILNDPAQIKVLSASANTEKLPEVISWMDADKHYGKVATVEGTVVATHNSGKACFLNFHKNWKRYFTVVIFASNFAKFKEPPERHFANKKVRVNGLIREYQGKPEIIVEGPNQISIVE
jgi:DNA/RNA endonuclease YhcR with UshA esterase domain